MLDKFNLADEQKIELQGYIDAQIKEAEERAKNDSEFIKTIKGNGIAEGFTKAQKAVLKNFGLQKDEIKDFENDFEKVLEFGLKKLASNKDATNQELQERLKSFEFEINKYKEEIIPSIKNEYESKFTQRLVNEKSLMGIADAKDNIIIDPSVFKTLFDSQIQAHGIVLSVENDKLDIKKNDGTFFYDGTKKIDNLHDLILFIAKTTKTLKESNGGAGNASNNTGNNVVNNTQIGSATKAMMERFGVK